MKPRRVIITLEVETDVSLFSLKSLCETHLFKNGIDVHQTQMNVVRSVPGRSKRKQK